MPPLRVCDHLYLINHRHIIILIDTQHLDSRGGMGGKGDNTLLLTGMEAAVDTLEEERGGGGGKGGGGGGGGSKGRGW